MLTTITPFWGRGDLALRVWVNAIRRASIPGVHHLIYFVGEAVPYWWSSLVKELPITAIEVNEPPGKSIGYYHNMGAKVSQTEWIMKLDVDAIPNVRYFRELYPILSKAAPREWFNGGMIYVPVHLTMDYLQSLERPLTALNYLTVLVQLKQPEASNFICRRDDYLWVGGSDPRFKNWGWEDYQQLYALEAFYRQSDPLPGNLDYTNVTQRCRDEIARPKARELFARNNWLCLLHRWHPPASREGSRHNREVLLDSILSIRRQYVN